MKQVSDSYLHWLLNRFVSADLLAENRDDYIQEARLAILQAMKNFKGQSSLETFAFTVVKNHFIDLHRKESKNIQAETTEERDYEDDDRWDGVDFMLSMVDLLTEEEFKIFQLHFVEGHSAMVIAQKIQKRRSGVAECINRIYSKYQSLEESRLRALTLNLERELFVNETDL